MSWLFDDDVCWCGNSDICGVTECFRHLKNRKPQSKPDVCTMANFMGNPDCPYYDEFEEDNDEI